jgi:hypothetical protein
MTNAGMPMPALVFWMPMPTYVFDPSQEQRKQCANAPEMSPVLPESGTNLA